MEKFNRGFGGLFGQPSGGDEDDSGAEAGDEETFTARFGWIFNAKQVADFEGVPLDYVYDKLPVMQFLNDISYLKEKEREDIRLLKPVNDGS